MYKPFLREKLPDRHSASYFYDVNGTIVEVWYDVYVKVWTAFVINNIHDRYQAGAAAYDNQRCDYIINAALDNHRYRSYI